jgi:hypothetical protein
VVEPGCKRAAKRPAFRLEVGRHSHDGRFVAALAKPVIARESGQASRPGTSLRRNVFPLPAPWLLNAALTRGMITNG